MNRLNALYLLLGAIQHNLGLSLFWRCMKALVSFCLMSTLAAAAGPEVGRPEVRSQSSTEAQGAAIVPQHVLGKITRSKLLDFS